MATERIQIVVSSKGAVTVKRDIDGIGAAGKRASGGVDLLKSALSTLAVYLSVGKIINYADSYTKLQNALRITGLEGEKLVAVQTTLTAQANKNGVELESLARVYSRASMAGKELGASQSDLEKLTSGLAASLKLTGQSASETRGPMLQLAQALGSPIVRAEEFNSILEGLLPIAQAAARGISGFDGSVSKLRQAVADGTITNKMFFEGLLVGLNGVEAQAKKANLTIGQSFTVLQNNLTLFIGEAATTSSAAALLSTVILTVANNLDLLAMALTPVVVALTYLGAEALILGVIAAFTRVALFVTSTFIPAMVALNAVLWANPYVILAGAIVAAGAALVYFHSQLAGTTGILAAIREVGVAAFNAVYEAVADGWAKIEPSLSAFFATVKAIYKQFDSFLWPIIGAGFPVLLDFLTKVAQGHGFWLMGLIEIGKYISVGLFVIFREVFTFVITQVALVINKFKEWYNIILRVINAIKTALGLGAKPGAAAAPAATVPGMREGGSFAVGGANSGTDNTPVSFNANRGERVTVETRRQQRESGAANSNGGGGDTNVKVPVAITNVFDPNMIPAGMASAKGQQTLINTIAGNRDEIARILGVA